jgi:hypothetical protein
MPLGQSFHFRPHRTKELMQARERQLSLGLNPRGAQNHEAAIAGDGPGLGEQPRLSHPWLAPDDERTARRLDSVEKRGEEPYFIGSTDQPSAVMRPD